MLIPIDNQPPSIDSDESDLGRVREFRRMKARLSELETLYASRFKFQVPTATSIKQQPLEKRCSQHLHVVVSLHAARVECAECGEPLDPIDVLRQFANTERTFADSLEHLREERSALFKEIEALKKQKQNLRNSIRKAGARPIERWQIKDEP
jgi:hypothetical protein